MIKFFFYLSLSIYVRIDIFIRDEKYKVKIEVDEVSTEHGYSNSFTIEQDITKIEWVLKKETNKALKMFDGSDKEWREMLHEMRDWS